MTPSTYERPSRPSPVRPVGESPAVDGYGRGFVLTTSAAPIVHFSGARARLLALASGERRHVVLLTGGGTRLTHAMHEGLQTFGGRWVVRTGDGLRDADTGRRLESIEDAVRPPGPAALAPEHGDIEAGEHEPSAILELSVVVRHRIAATAPYGESVRRLAAAFLEEPELDWGVREPVVTPWDDDAVAAFIRDRHGSATAVVIAGGGADGRSLVGSLRVRPEGRGAEEVLALRIDLGEPNDDRTVERWLEVAERFTELAALDGLLNATAMASFGPPDLSVWPWLRPPPIPMALLVGPVGVARFGIDDRRVAIETHFAAEFVGPARRPSLVVELGERPHPDNAGELGALLGVLGPDAVVAGLGATTPATLFGADWRETTRSAAAERLGVEDGGLEAALGLERSGPEDLADASELDDAEVSGHSINGEDDADAL